MLTGIGAMTVVAPGCLSANVAQSPTTDEQLAGTAGFQAIRRVNQIQDNQLQAQVGNVALSVIRNGDSSYSAFNRRCTHAGCTVNWQGNQNKFVCPCHNSQFDANGQVAQGPARSPLQSYSVQVQGDQIFVKLDA